MKNQQNNNWDHNARINQIKLYKYLEIMQEMFLNLQIKSHKTDMSKLYKNISDDIIKILEFSGILDQKK